jgi:hypothetical protein
MDTITIVHVCDTASNDDTLTVTDMPSGWSVKWIATQGGVQTEDSKVVEGHTITVDRISFPFVMLACRDEASRTYGTGFVLSTGPHIWTLTIEK